MIYNTCKNIRKIDDLYSYLSSDLINELYFKPKKVNKDLINKKIKDNKYIEKFNNTINTYKELNIEKIISEKIKEFEQDTSYKINNYKIYTIIGLDTTTIYSIKYNNEDITVLLLESTNGKIDILNMLLAHEFTHFVRKQIFKKDIFENSIGERFIVEGIGCNYSREIVPNKEDYEYCIVNKDTTEWVKKNIKKIEKHMKNKIKTNELMSDYFYMYADTEKTGLQARTGYVYGYLKVKEYLEKNNLKIKNIIDKDWQEIFDNLNIYLTSYGLDTRYSDYMNSYNEIINILKNKKVAIIPNAKLINEDRTNSIIAQKELNKNNIEADIIDINSNTNINNYSALYLSGGEPKNLMDSINSANLFDDIKKFINNGGTIIGQSAGAMIFCEKYFDTTTGELLIMNNGFDYSDKMIVPHYENLPSDLIEKMPKNILKIHDSDNLYKL